MKASPRDLFCVHSSLFTRLRGPQSSPGFYMSQSVYTTPLLHPLIPCTLFHSSSPCYFRSFSGEHINKLRQIDSNLTTSKQIPFKFLPQMCCPLACSSPLLREYICDRARHLYQHTLSLAFCRSLPRACRGIAPGPSLQ